MLAGTYGHLIFRNLYCVFRHFEKNNFELAGTYRHLISRSMHLVFRHFWGKKL